MKRCEQIRAALHSYMDRELAAAEVHAVEAHLVECAACRGEYDSAVSVSEAVRAVHPLYETPAESFERARQQVRAHQRRVHARHAAIAAAVVLAGFVSMAGLRTRQDPFASYASGVHTRYSRGAMPLDVRSQQPQEVAAWLRARLPFHLELPDYPEGPGASKKYALVGARLAQYESSDVAYLAYEMQGKPISLVIGSAGAITPSGGETLRAGGLDFHITRENGLSVITWVDKDLAYALVSDLQAVGAESCAVCHGGADQRQKFEPLTPRI